MAHYSHYTVFEGRKTGVFHSFEETLVQVDGHCGGAYQRYASFEAGVGPFTLYDEYFGAFETGTRGHIPFSEACHKPTVIAAIDYANKQLPTMLAVGNMVQKLDACTDYLVVPDGCEPNVGNNTGCDHNQTGFASTPEKTCHCPAFGI